jgi:hypothetical protein
MAEPKFRSANIAYTTDTFGAWVERTNQIVFDMSEIVVTAQQNTQGGATSGNVVITSNVYNYDTNAYVNSTGGIFQANTLAAFNYLRGGNTSVANTLYIIANTNMSNGSVNVASNSTVNSVTVKGTWADIESTSAYVNGTLLQVSSNVHINSTSVNTSINSTSLHVTGALIDVNSTTADFDGSTLTADYNLMTLTGNVIVNSDDTTITANDFTVKSNSSISVIDLNGDGTSSSLTIAGNLVTIDSDESQFNANVTFGSSNADTVSVVSEVDTGVSPVSNALSLGLTDARWNLNSNTVNVSNTLTVTGNATFHSDVALGDANTDTISINGEVDTNINPEANAQTLGLADARWDLNAEDINASKTLVVTGTGDFSNTLDVVGAGTFSNTVNVVGAGTFSNTVDAAGLVTAAADLNTTTANASVKFNAGANVTIDTTSVFIKGTAAVGNVIANSSSLHIGNNTVNTHISKGGINTDGTLAVLKAGTFSNTIGVTGAATFSDTIGVTNTATFSNTVDATGLVTASGGVNTTTANASVAINVGANVNVTTAALSIGNSTVNTVISDQQIITDGSLDVLGGTTLRNGLQVVIGTSTMGGTLGVTGALNTSNTLEVTGAGTFSNTIGVTGAATLSSTMNVTGAAIFSNTVDITGQTNATEMNLSGNLYVGTAAGNGFNSITVGNSSQNSSFTSNGITLGGGFLSVGALNAGNTTTTGWINVSGDAAIGGNLTSALDHTGATANLVSGKLYITDTGVTVAANTALQENVTITGDLEVIGTTGLSGNAALALNVATMSTLAVSANTTLDGQTTIGDGAGVENLYVYSIVGNSTVGFIPDSSNATPLGSATNRWIVSANTGDFSGLITSRNGIKPVSNTVGQALGDADQRFTGYFLGGNFSADVTVATDIDISGEANTATLKSVGAADLQSTLVVGNTSTLTGAANVLSTMGVDGALNAHSTMGVTNTATFSNTVSVVGDLTISSDIKDDGGNTFRVYYANGVVAWPA